jgi:hypothetical protein
MFIKQFLDKTPMKQLKKKQPTFYISSLKTILLTMETNEVVLSFLFGF